MTALYIILGIAIALAILGWLAWQFLGPIVELDAIRWEEASSSSQNHINDHRSNGIAKRSGGVSFHEQGN